MLQSIKYLNGYTIFATDGEIGTVEDFYFDDFSWRIQYFVVVAGNWLFGRRVLISPVYAGPADENARRIPVKLTREQVRNSPNIDTQKPVSRQHDMPVANYLWPTYGLVPEAMFPPPLPDPAPPEPARKADPNLRSTNEVRGYHVSATDEDVGKVEDFVFDEASWDIRFIIVDAGKWLNRELVLIAPQWVADISWEERTVHSDLDSKAIRSSPKFHPVFPISTEYAAELHHHYGKKVRDNLDNEPKVHLGRAETKALYDRISKVYDLLSERSEEPVRQTALDRLAAQAGETILEIGVGTGHCLVALAKAVGPAGRVHGIDLSDGMLAEAGALVGGEGNAGRVELRLGDAVALPYGDGVMDGVLMTFTLELFEYDEIRIVLQECKRVLKSGGRIVVAAMSKEGEHGLIYDAYQWTHRHFPNFVDCRPISVRKAIEAAGFAVESSDAMQIWVPVEVVRGVK